MGSPVGTVVGTALGSVVGTDVGTDVGVLDGIRDCHVGSSDGRAVVGPGVGSIVVGLGLGTGFGTRVGFGVGTRVGFGVGSGAPSGVLYEGRGVGAGEGAGVVGAGVGASVCETSKSTYVQEQKSVIFSRQSPFVGCTVGAGVGDTDSVGMPVGSFVRAIVGVALIGIDGSLVGYSEMVGVGVGAQVPAAFRWTPHDVDAHWVPENAS